MCVELVTVGSVPEVPNFFVFIIYFLNCNINKEMREAKLLRITTNALSTG